MNGHVRLKKLSDVIDNDGLSSYHLGDDGATTKKYVANTVEFSGSLLF